MVQRKMGINIVLNTFKTVLTILFPIFTYPYVTRVLGVSNIGAVNLSASIISYFAMFASLGISTYAIREGGKVRHDSEKLKYLTDQIFSIHILATVIAFLFMLIALPFINGMNLKILVLIQSISIIFSTFGVEWVNILFEDYLYITVRSLVVQLITLISIFLFVRTPGDTVIYVSILTLSSGLICLMNWIYCRRYLKLGITWKLNLQKHFKPILILFSGTLAINIYVTSDTILLGILKGTYYVGIYSLAVKIYTISKNVLASIYSTAVARLSVYYGKNDFDNFRKLYTHLINVITLLLLPLSSGLLSVAPEVILFMGGSKFTSSILTLQLLSISLVGAIYGGAITYCLNVPIGKEKINLYGAIYGIVVNIGVSLLLIPMFNQNGTAVATICSEFFILYYSLKHVRNMELYFEKKSFLKNLLAAVIESTVIFLLSKVSNFFISEGFFRLIFIVISSLASYIAILKILKNEIYLEILAKLKNKWDSMF